MADEATPISLREGDEITADIAIPAGRTGTIRGTLANFAPDEQPTFEIRMGGEPVSPGLVDFDRATGKFEIPEAIRGSYELYATQRDSTASTAVSVDHEDVDGVNLRLSPPLEIPLETHFEGDGDLAGSCKVELAPTGLFGNTYVSGYLKGGGQSIHAVPPGTYRAQIVCTGGYVRSAFFGSQELLTNPSVTIGAGATPPAIRMEGVDGGGILSAKISGTENASLLIAPEFAGSTGPLMTSRGVLTISDLAPGDYTVWAFSADEPLPFREPDFLKTLPPGVRVSIADDQTTEIELKAIEP
jgi:hypothetical protein